jgi:O-antigen/teichoic acid export membrane protein
VVFRVGSTLSMAIQSYFLWSFLQRFGTFVIRLLGLIVLARLLTPSDYGTFAAASMVILAVTIIIEFGASAHLNRVKEVTAGIIGSSLLFSGGIGLVLIPLVYICAPTIGELVSVNAVEEPLRLMLLGLTVAPFTAVTNALLIRDGKFRRQMHVGLAVESFATALSVALAIAGQGIQALAIAAVVTNVPRHNWFFNGNPDGTTQNGLLCQWLGDTDACSTTFHASIYCTQLWSCRVGAF